MVRLHVFKDNTCIITVSDVMTLAGQALDGGDCSVTLEDANGVEIAGQAWPLALTWDADAGVFRGTILSGLAVELGDAGNCLIEYTSPDGDDFADVQTFTVRRPTL